MPRAADEPGRRLERNRVLGGLVGSGGGARRAFVDATGALVSLPPVIRRVVATDDEVGALLLGMGAPLVGCAGTLADMTVVGAPRVPDPRAVAALRPDVILTSAVDGVHDLADARMAAVLRAVAPVIAVETAQRTAATADLKAMLGQLVGGGRPASDPVSTRRVGAP